MPKLPDVQQFDKTLAEVDKAMERLQNDYPRHYLGMSQIGEECWRKLFYGFRNAESRKIPASGLKAIEDGYAQEEAMARRLRMVDNIQLYTVDPEDPTRQISFEMLLGHFRGHCDGIIFGLVEAPKTWHIWEHKSVNLKKFEELKKLRHEKGEKEALYYWDSIYYGQAQIYMHEGKLERHFLTVTSPGGRDHISVRTEYKKQMAENIIEKAKAIIFDNWVIPARISDKREYFKCKWCEFQEVCHDGQFPLVNCKTCRYREPVENAQNKCSLTDEIISDFSGCRNHIYNPALIDSKLVEQQKDGCLYQLPDKTIFANVPPAGWPDMDKHIDAFFTSEDLRNKIKYVSNITKDVVAVQNAFSGEIDPENIEKEWNTKDRRLKDI